MSYREQMGYVQGFHRDILASIQRGLARPTNIKQNSLSETIRQGAAIGSLPTRAIVAQNERNLFAIEQLQTLDKPAAAQPREVTLVAAIAGSLIWRIEVEKVSLAGILK